MRHAARVLRRIFCWIVLVFLAAIPVHWATDGGAWWHVAFVVVFVPALLAALCAGFLARAKVEPETVEVDPPVAGSWWALNSPATRTPSHGTRTNGQAYAIDVLINSEERPASGWWPVTRRSEEFPAFGEPLLAVADATVVTCVDHRRDSRSRTSYPGLAYFFVEGTFRSLGGCGQIMGNHVILDLGGGTYALYAHVQRGSLRVRAGDRVRVGQVLAGCGNSGNTTEPHLHFQLMDRADPELAQGVPFTWRGVGVPADTEHFTAPAPVTP